MTAELFNLLYQKDEIVEFRPIKPPWRGKGAGQSEFIKFNGNISSKLTDLIQRKNQDFNLYFGVMPRIKIGETKKISRINACFIDLDKKDFPSEEDFNRHIQRLESEILPSINLRYTAKINSGRGLHYYFIFHPEKSLPIKVKKVIDEKTNKEEEEYYCEEHREIQCALIEICKSDTSIKDLPRIMRLPGSINIKEKDNFKDCKIVELHPEHLYEYINFLPLLKKYRAILQQKREIKERNIKEYTSQSTPGTRQQYIDIILQVLQERGQGLFNDYEEYLRFCMGCKAEGLPYESIDAILQLSENYDYDENVKRYEKLEPRKIEFGTVYHYAKIADSERLNELLKAQNKKEPSPPVDTIPGMEVREAVETHPPGPVEEKKEEYPPLVGFTLKELMEEEFPPIKYLVQDILPEGLTILAGKPKIGKSILALNLSMSIAKGCLTLGKLSTEKTEVAYFALEDNKRRLKKRALPILKENFPENFTFFNSLLPLTKGGYEQLNSYLDSHPEVKFIVIDTIGRVKPPSYSGNSYEVDTQLYSKLHDIYLKRNVSVLVITHTKKQEALDFIDNVTGSAGSTGVADTVLVLSKNRTEKEAVLKVTGRDIEEEQEFALRLNSDLFSWEILGSAEFYTQSKERKEIIDILLREEMPMTNKDLQGLLNKNYNAVRFLTWKMEKDGILLKINNSYVISPSYVITSTNTTNSANSANTANSANSIESVSDIVSSVSLEKNTANSEKASDTNGKNKSVSDVSGVSGKVTCKSCEYFNSGPGGPSSYSGTCQAGGAGGCGTELKTCRFYKEVITETPF